MSAATTPLAGPRVILRVERTSLERAVAVVLDTPGLLAMRFGLEVQVEALGVEVAEIEFGALTPGVDAIVAGVLEARGITVLATRTVVERWHGR